jgi:hypothetical protein
MGEPSWHEMAEQQERVHAIHYLRFSPLVLQHKEYNKHAFLRSTSEPQCVTAEDDLPARRHSAAYDDVLAAIPTITHAVWLKVMSCFEVAGGQQQPIGLRGGIVICEPPCSIMRGALAM